MNNVVVLGHNCRTTAGLQYGNDVLEEVELLVRGRDLEVIALIEVAIGLAFAVFADYGEDDFLPNGGFARTRSKRLP